ncbi:hypothetical protein KR018_005504 [Drosophila ironensis]|nr:hypothetical protein KR018_005504 [Drosophila ironensis]
MLHRSMYLDAFNDKMTKQNPVSLCFASVFPLARMKDYTVIGTDNKDFVIYYKCNYFSVSKNHVEIVNVYTREKTPSAGVLTGITEAFKKNGLDEAKVMILC